jgi:hypothetical protein
MGRYLYVPYRLVTTRMYRRRKMKRKDSRWKFCWKKR